MNASFECAERFHIGRGRVYLAVLFAVGTITCSAAGAAPVAVLQVGPGAPVTAIAFSPDGTHLLTGSADETAAIWDLPSGKIRAVLRGHTEPITSVDYSPLGNLAATGARDGVRLWDTKTGTEAGLLAGTNPSIRSVVFSPDGQRLVTCSYRPLTIWDTASRQPILDYGPQSARAVCAAFTPNGKALVTGHEDGILRIWDVEDVTLKATLTGQQGSAQCLALSPDATRIASGSSTGQLYLWNTATRTIERTIQTQDKDITSVAFSPDGAVVASIGSAGQPRFWNAATGALLGTLDSRNHPGLSRLCFAPRTGTFAAAGGTAGAPGAILLWDAADFPIKTRLAENAPGTETRLAENAPGTENTPQVLAGKTDAITCLSYSPDGKLLATGSGHTLRIWDAATGALKYSVPGDDNWVKCLAWSPDSATIASGGAGQTIRIYSLENGKETVHLTPVWGADILTYSPDGSLVAAGSGWSEVRVWSAATGKLEKALTLPNAVPEHLIAISSDNHLIVVGSRTRRDAWVFDVATGALQFTIQGHTSSLLALAFSPDSATIVSGAWDRTIRLWDAKTGQPKATLQYNRPVQQMAFLPDGKLLAIASLNGPVQLLDLAANTAAPLPDPPVGIPANMLHPVALEGGGIAVHSTRTGKILVVMYPVPAGTGDVSWFVQTPEGYFSCADDALPSILWNDDGDLVPADHYATTFRQPDRVQKALQDAE